MSTRNVTLKDADARKLLNQVDELYSAKGKKVAHVDLKATRPSWDELKKLMLGPTGNLRAPTVRVGKALLVGFDEDSYRRVLKK